MTEKESALSVIFLYVEEHGVGGVHFLFLFPEGQAMERDALPEL